MFVNFGIGFFLKDLENIHPDINEYHVLSETREHKKRRNLIKYV